ncbi:MAG TPA: hypothetical protein VLG46_10570, partial [Anaerolineae bacterium]|nr:hypothetical protein [Anaerolineae bacterium]
MSRWIIFLLVVGVLTACGQPGPTTLPAATAPAVGQPPTTASIQTQPATTDTPQVESTPAQLEGTPYARFAVRASDNSIQIVNTQVPVDRRVTTGLLPLGGEAGGTVYALDFTNQPQAVAADQAGTRPLD